MGWESSDVFRFGLGPLSRSNDGSLALVSCLFGGYKFVLALRCIGLVATLQFYYAVTLCTMLKLHQTLFCYGNIINENYKIYI